LVQTSVRKTVVILLEVIFTEFHARRIGAAALGERFDVRVLDLTPWIRPDFWRLHSGMRYQGPGCSEIYSRQQFLDALDKINCAVAFDHLGNGPLQEDVRTELARRTIPRALYMLGVVPSAPPPRGWARVRAAMTRKLPRRFWIKARQKLRSKLGGKILGSPPDIMVHAGEAGLAKAPAGVRHLIAAHSLDYDEFLKCNGQFRTTEPFAVFLDENMVHHSDYAFSHLVPPTTEPNYFPALNAFFDEFETRTGMEVRFAAHPRSNYEQSPHLLGGRSPLREQTAQLVRDSSLVFAHGSTSIAFAALWRKPIVFLTNSDIERSWYGGEIRVRAELFDAPYINIDKFGPEEIDLALRSPGNEQACAEYVRLYVKTPGSAERPLWSIVSDYIEERL
jgi:hypothetical protein